MQITNAGDLENLKKGEVIELSPFASGIKFVARLRRPSLFNLCKVGEIPNSLVATAQRIFEGEKTGDIVKYGEVLHLVAKAALVEPGYEDVKELLTDEQLTDIYNYTQRGAEGMMALNPFRRFREESAKPKKSGDSSKGK
jgi:hypothetical protein